MINTGGHKVHAETVEAQLAGQLQEPFFITGLPHPSLGEQVVLVIEGDESERKLNFQTLHPYEKPKKIIFVPKFTYTASGKTDRNGTLNSLT